MFGPHFFVLCINDLPRINAIRMVFLYAVDTNIINDNSDTKSIINIIKTRINKISTWCKSIKLKMNNSFTMYLRTRLGIVKNTKIDKT